MAANSGGAFNLDTMRRILTRAQWASINYTNREGEKAISLILPGVDYRRIYEQDIAKLEAILPRMERLLPRIGGNLALIEAARQILASREESLRVGLGNNTAYTQQGTYEHLAPGFKVHTETGDLYVIGIVVRKRVIVKGVYKPVKHKNEVTAAKRRIEKILPSGRIRQWKLTSLSRVAASRTVVEDDTLVLE